VSGLVTLVGGGAMLRSLPNGDIDSQGVGAPGLFVADVRVLSRLVLTVNGSQGVVAAESTDADRRSVVLTESLPRHATPDVVVSRRQAVAPSGLVDEIEVLNLTRHRTTSELVVELASDFADPFMLRSDRLTFDTSAGRYVANRRGAAGLVFGYRRSLGDRSFAAEVSIAATGEPAIEFDGGDRAVPSARIRWTVALGPGQTAAVSLAVTSGHDRTVPALPPKELNGLSPRLAGARGRALADLDALRMPFPLDERLTIVAAGSPWFLTLFGRDALHTSLLTEADLPGLGDDILLALMATQAVASEPRRVAEPGKILHELRVSELATLDEVPYGRYYGSVDATPLFLTALATVGSEAVQRAGEASARAAVDWMRGAGGIDSTGFLRYVSDPNGLITQGWKDSADSVAHADGSIATGAIALCEVQGYAWRALVDTARLAREVWNDGAWAAELELLASGLRERFRARFWMPDRDFPALALDGDDRRVEVVASDAGHLLFSGILDDTDARRVAARLLEDDMFTGWGIRTLSSTEVRYSPLSYHNGSVWPHDTALAAVGMARYGLTEQARAVASALVDASAHFGDRPAELFGGFDRASFPEPVTYAHAAAPQAWASAALLAATRILAPQPQEAP
jgi:glycogen debranching enzyme